MEQVDEFDDMVDDALKSGPEASLTEKPPRVRDGSFFGSESLEPPLAIPDDLKIAVVEEDAPVAPVSDTPTGIKPPPLTVSPNGSTSLTTSAHNLDCNENHESQNTTQLHKDDDSDNDKPNLPTQNDDSETKQEQPASSHSPDKVQFEEFWGDDPVENKTEAASTAKPTPAAAQPPDQPTQQLSAKPRKVLGPSKVQQSLEQKEEHQDSDKEEEPPKEEKKFTTGGLQTSLLKKFNLAPTNILDQYMDPGEEKHQDEADGWGDVPSNSYDSDDEKREEPLISTELDDENDPWAQVTELRTQQMKDRLEGTAGIGIKAKSSTRDSYISYDQALTLLRNNNEIAPFRKKIKVWDLRNVDFLTSCKFYVFGKPKLKGGLQDERDDVFCMAQMPVDYEYEHHDRIFQTIYRIVTGEMLTCPRFGSHWEVCGFQGTDPGTDIRGAGMLGPLQILYLLKEHRFLALKIHRLSRDDLQNFPFAVVSFNLTGIVLQVLREGKLYSMIKKSKSVMDVCNELYCAIVFYFYIEWKNNGFTIADFSGLRDTIDARAKKNPRKLIKFFIKHNSAPEEEEQLEFTHIP
mmetsp:Transcript_36366/g.71438  ORF Transcript_36366/g.71438 Transcript_36366/m.71438 type:complete len:575 (-) Transcript_36366:284-2008(-)